MLGAFPVSAVEIPASVLATLTAQLDLAPITGIHAYFDGSSRIRHLTLIRTHCGFTDFGDNVVARFRLTRWLYALCWSGDDRPGPLIDHAAAWLIANKVLLPGVTVLELLVGRIRDRARTRLWRHLFASLAGSLKLGHLKVVGVMRMLQVKDRPTSLAKALSELGRIIKALHIRFCCKNSHAGSFPRG